MTDSLQRAAEYYKRSTNGIFALKCVGGVWRLQGVCKLAKDEHCRFPLTKTEAAAIIKEDLWKRICRATKDTCDRNYDAERKGREYFVRLGLPPCWMCEGNDELAVLLEAAEEIT